MIGYRCDATRTETAVDPRDLVIAALPVGFAVCWHCPACHQVQAEPLTELTIDVLQRQGWDLFAALMRGVVV